MFHSIARAVVMLGCMTSISLAQTQSTTIASSAIEHKILKTIAPGEHVRIEKMMIPDGMVDLELDRITVLNADATLIVGSKEGQQALARPDVAIFSGVVAGIPDSVAYLAVSPFGTNGFIEINGELTSISTGPHEQGKNLVEALRTGRMADLITPDDTHEVCGYAPGDTALEPSGPMIDYPANENRGAPSCRIAEIALDTDWEYIERIFGGDHNAAAAYMVTLMGAISEIYERDVNVRLTIPFLRVWSDDSDPYSVAAGDPLDLVRDEWAANMGSVNRTLTHLFTGRTDISYGGVAYLSVLCNTGFGYGVSGYHNGSFPYPLADNHSGNWDVVVTSHELGHNFGTSHTHNYSPQIDGCGTGDCGGAFGGTIMSYCHTCTGGITNIVLQFHPRVQDVIIGYMDSISGSCDLTAAGLSAVADSMETIPNIPLQIDALGNDLGQSCESFSLDSFDALSVAGGVVELLAGQGPGGRDMFMYTPALDFSGADSFEYTIIGSSGAQSATVSIDVLELRAADNRIQPIDGLGVKYYSLVNPSALPDFDIITPLSEDVSTSVNYESTSGEFMNSGRADDVGAVFTGYVQVFFGGIYTFTTESDDGSALYIGDEKVVDNDGLHGMVKRSGSIPLAAGWHRVRIEFFERGGGAGLASTIIWPTGDEFLLENANISHEVAGGACSIADFNADGTLNFFDVSAFLEAFGVQDPDADLTGNGTFNFFDISAFLDAYALGCP